LLLLKSRFLSNRGEDELDDGYRTLSIPLKINGEEIFNALKIRMDGKTFWFIPYFLFVLSVGIYDCVRSSLNSKLNYMIVTYMSSLIGCNSKLRVHPELCYTLWKREYKVLFQSLYLIVMKNDCLKECTLVYVLRNWDGIKLFVVSFYLSCSFIFNSWYFFFYISLHQFHQINGAKLKAFGELQISTTFVLKFHNIILVLTVQPFDYRFRHPV